MVSDLIKRLRHAVERDVRDEDYLEALLHEAVIALHRAEAEALRLQREIGVALDRDVSIVAELTTALRAASMAAAAIRAPERQLREHYERVVASRHVP